MKVVGGIPNFLGVP